MSKYEGIHRAGNHESLQESSNLFESVRDVYTRSTRASDVVLGGMIEGACAESRKEFQHPDRLLNDAWIAVKNGVTGNIIGLGLRACPEVALLASAYSIGTWAEHALPALKTVAPDLQKTWQKSYAENDVNKLQLYKSAVGKTYGHAALEFGIGATSAVIGFNSGFRPDRLLKTRVDGLTKTPHVLKNFSEHNPLSAFKALYVDKSLQRKPPGTRVKVEHDGTKNFYHSHNDFEKHYPDGSKFRKSANGITRSQHVNGERTTEIPGVMNILDKRNGDRVYSYHRSGLVETHKPSGTVIKEHKNGIVETQRTDGTTYREHPDGTTDVIKRQAS
jgi:hypothetical protein